jgi:hypothetical protein
MVRSDERGVALVMAMFMTLMVSALAASMAYVARSETLSSQSYTTMAQARYAAESGLAAAANYLLSGPYVAIAPGTATDPLTNYDRTVSPVRWSNSPVQLSTEPGASNHPVNAVVQGFQAAAAGTLTVSNGTVAYGARATLLSVRVVTDTMGGGSQAIQTWEITGVGRRDFSGSANAEVIAIIERQTVPAIRYGAFATNPACGALLLSGGAKTYSYDSTAPLAAGAPVLSQTGGDIGTNGNLDISGTPTQVYGTLSTPRTGTGKCTAANVTAISISGKASVQEGLIELPQEIEFEPPPPPSPMPPTTNVGIDNGFTCLGAGLLLGCSKSGGTVTLSAGATGGPIVLGNVSVKNTLVLNEGTYIVNSITASGNPNIQVNGKVTLIVAGQGQATPIDLTGGAVVNPSFDPQNFQIIYGGTGTVKTRGGAQTSAFLYAPDAFVTMSGGGKWYGAVVSGKLDLGGGTELYFDRNLMSSMVSAGAPVMSSFTWASF